MMRSTSPSLMPLTSASASRMPQAVPSGTPVSGTGGGSAATGASGSSHSTTYSFSDVLTSRPSTVIPHWRASSRISRLGYMPGSWVSTPARKCAGQCALSHADWNVGSANAAACALQNPNDANASRIFQMPSTTGWE